MRRLVLLALLLWARPARASLLELWVESGLGTLRGGASGGADLDWFDAGSGGAVSLSAGAHLLFIDAWVDHLELFGGELGGSYTQLMAGFGGIHELRAFKLWLGVGGGYGFWSWPEAVLVPGQDAEAVVAEGRFGLEHTLVPLGFGGVGLAVWGSVGYHYQLGSETLIDVTAGTVEFDPVHGLHWRAFAGLRAHFEL